MYFTLDGSIYDFIFLFLFALLSLRLASFLAFDLRRLGGHRTWRALSYLLQDALCIWADAVLLKKFIIHKNAVLATPAPRPAAVGTGHAFCFIVLEIAFFFCQNGFDVFIYFGEYNFQ